jgi:predicted secreted protein
MASTGYQNGTDIGLYVDSTLVAFGTSHDFETTLETRDASSKDSLGWAEKREGQRSWTVSGEFIFAEDAAYGFTDLFALINARSQVEVRFSSDIVGDKEYTGQAYLTSLSKSAPNEDTVTYSGSFEGTGAIVESVNAI